MLRYPEHSNTLFNIMTYDPGTNAGGLAVFTLDAKENSLVSSISNTFYSDKMLSRDLCVETNQGEVMTKIQSQCVNISNMLNNYNVSVFCCETPFFNPTRPGAYGVLMRLNQAIRTTVINYNPLTTFNEYAPRFIKMTVCGLDKGIDKDTMRRHVLSRTDLNYVGDTPINQLGPDAIDALGIGITEIKTNYKGILI